MVGFENGTKLWTKTETGNKSTVGMYYIDGAYGGWALYKMVSEGGAVSDVLRNGHQPAKDLYMQLWAYIEGLRVNAKD